MFASIGPSITMLGGEETNRRCLFSVCVDATELLLKFRCIELLATIFMINLEELILADYDNVWVFFVIVFHWVVTRFCWNTTRIKHPIIAGHGHWKLPHVFWFECLLIYLLLEFEYSSS